MGSSSKAAAVFTREDEDKLWDLGVLGTENLKALLRAVFFLNGKNFSLRGGEEHRSLRFTQIERKLDPNCYIYTENTSKHRTGSLAQLRVSNKVVPVFAIPEAGTRCHVYILDMYYEKVPSSCLSGECFYLQPLSKIPKVDKSPWFTSVPVGRNTLSKMVKDICLEGGIKGGHTNHSLRATGASELFQNGISEKVIQLRTGHLSLQGLRHYERVTDEQQLEATRVLSVLSSVSKNDDNPKKEETPAGACFPQMKFSQCTVNVYQGPVAFKND